MSYDLTGEKISFTYGRVVQVVSGSYYDGFGNLLPIGTSSIIITGSTANFATTGSNTFIGNQIVSGSIIVTNGITGSLYGTSSYSLNTLSASYSLTSSYSNTSSYSDTSLSASYALSSSYAVTSSYAILAENANNATNSQNAQDILVYVKNTSGAIITKGHLVRIVGVDNNSNNPTIELADYSNENNSANTLGYTNQDFGINAFGYVITEGKLIGVDTSNFTSGDLLYLSSSGNFTNVRPPAPKHGVRVGQVIRSQLNNGSIYVTIDNGVELDELHNVSDTTTSSSYGDLLIRSGSVWTNSKNLTGSYILSGSLTTNDGINCISVTASIYGTSSWSNNSLTASYVNGSIVSSSYALTASYALNSNGGTSLITGSTYFITSSWSNNSLTSSYVEIAQSASYYNGTITSASYALSASYAPVNTNITSSWSNNSITASYALSAQSASYYGGNVNSASYALSSSYSPTNITASWANNSISSSYSLTSSNVIGGTSNYIPLWSSNTSLSNSILYQNNNSIGIGVNSPSGKLHISASATSLESALYLSKGSGSITQYYINAVDQNNNLNYRLSTDVNNHAETKLYYLGTAKVSHNTYWPSWINNDSYTNGGLGIGTNSQTHGYGLFVAKSSTSGSLYVSGSSIFTGSINVNGNINSNVITASLFFGTASLSNTASYYEGSVISSSYSLSSSYAPTNTNITTSWSNNSLTSSYVVTAQTASYYGGSVLSSSYSTTSSYIRNAVSSSYSLSSSYSVSASYAPTNPNITASFLTTTNNYKVNSFTSSNLSTTGLVNFNSSGSTSFTTNGTLTLSGQNTKGGSTAHDFLYITNTNPSALNPSKYLRLNSDGNFEIINDAYNNRILALTDSGSLQVPVARSENVTQLRNTGGGLKVGNYGHFFDDGNVHIHSTSPGTNLWLNCSGSGKLVVNGQTGATGGMCIGTDTQNGFVTIVGSVSAAITQPYGYLISSGAGTTTGTSPNPYSLTCDSRIMAQEFDAPSDERLKNIQGEIPLNKAIDLVTKITPIQFTWKNNVDIGLKVGFSAQQTYKAGFEHLINIVENQGLPQTTDDDGFTSPQDAQFVMNYEQVIPYHTKLIKHLLEKIEQLENKINSLENKLI